MPKLCILLFVFLAGCTHRPDVQITNYRFPLPPSSSGCFVGSSDPTLDPVTSWNQAADMALAKAGEAVLGSRIRAGSRTTGLRDSFGVAMHETQGTLKGLGVVGWWFDREGKGARSECRKQACSKPNTMWAVACFHGYERLAPKILPDAFRGPIPAWLKNPSLGKGNRLCAIGVSAPTFQKEKAIEFAIEHAKQRLAQQQCLYLKSLVVDWVDDRSWQFPETSTAGHILENTMENAKEQHVWRDKLGIGPLRRKGVTYVQVCIENPDFGCD